MNKIDKTGVILAGGKSTRMKGRPKGLLTLQGIKFIEHSLKALSCFEEVMIIANEPELYKGFGVPVYKDILPHCGPLSGIHAGLSYANFNEIVVVACDMPFVQENYIRKLAEEMSRQCDYDVVIPMCEQRLQPLCAGYSKGLLISIEEKLRNNDNGLIKFIKETKHKVIEVDKEDESTFNNINTVEEYRKVTKPVVGIVGSRSNVGKTETMVAIIQTLKTRGYRVGTIKHDVHGFQMDHEGKDTYKHAQAGSDVVVISSKNKMARIENVQEEYSLSSLIDTMRNVDIILVEGYKNSKIPKIEVFRSDLCEKVYCPKEQLIAIFSDIQLTNQEVPVILKHEIEKLVDIIEEKVIKC